MNGVSVSVFRPGTDHGSIGAITVATSARGSSLESVLRFLTRHAEIGPNNTIGGESSTAPLR